jgi:cytochrome c-type biogenesis protein
MEALFTVLTRAIEGTPLVAIGAALAWGVLSMVLSPCHLASIPLLVGFIDGQGRVSTKRAFLIALLFSVGLLITIGLLGAVTAALGRIMGDMGRIGRYIVAGVFFVVGLNLLGVIPTPFSRPDQVDVKRKGLLGAFILGLVFGIALGPCTFAFMAPILGVTFGVAATNLPYGVLLLVAYGVGHCAVIVLAGTFAGVVQQFVDWNEKAKGTRVLRRACGVLVILGGLYLLYTS